MILLAQRLLALGAAALLAAVAGLAVAARDRAAPTTSSRLPRPAVSTVSGWYRALAGVRSRPLAHRRSACGTLLSPRTLGVDHPVLPCGALVFVRFRSTTALTRVVDRGPFAAGEDFELTPALARLLGLSGVQTIRWSFARAG